MSEKLIRIRNNIFHGVVKSFDVSNTYRPYKYKKKNSIKKTWIDVGNLIEESMKRQGSFERKK